MIEILQILMNSTFWKAIVAVLTTCGVIEIALQIYALPLERQILKLKIKKLKLEVDHESFLYRSDK